MNKIFVRRSENLPIENVFVWCIYMTSSLLWLGILKKKVWNFKIAKVHLQLNNISFNSIVYISKDPLGQFWVILIKIRLGKWIVNIYFVSKITKIIESIKLISNIDLQFIIEQEAIYSIKIYPFPIWPILEFPFGSVSFSFPFI